MEKPLELLASKHIGYAHSVDEISLLKYFGLVISNISVILSGFMTPIRNNRTAMSICNLHFPRNNPHPVSLNLQIILQYNAVLGCTFEEK